MDSALYEPDNEVLPVVYFISSEGKKGFPIKIGRSTTNAIHGRLSSLQTGMPYKLSFMLVCHAEPEQELAMHRAFARIRLQGEWFRRTRDLVDFIKAVEAESGDWPELLRPRFKLTEAGKQKELEDIARETSRLDEMRAAMNLAEAQYYPARSVAPCPL